MSGVSKLTADRNQRILLELVSKPGNDVCADCKARTPRWASHNLGIFLCMNCASIHRKIGTHITKVKSVTMDSWSKDQVEVMKSIGNLVSNAKYNPNEIRHPPPANREESERDSELEKFIRWKYEFRRFMATPSSNPSSDVNKAPPIRAQSAPAVSVARRQSPAPPIPTPHIANPVAPPNPSGSRPFSASTTDAVTTSRPAIAPSPPSAPPIVQPHVAPAPKNPVWDDIMSLAGPSVPPMSQFQQPAFASPVAASTPYATLSPTNPFPLADRSTSRSTSLQGTQSSIVNPFVIAQQQTGFATQPSSALFQPQTSSLQSSFAQPSYPPFAQAPQASFPQSYTQLPHQQQPQQFALLQAQAPVYQQQQPAQGRNPFVTPSQQAGLPGQQIALTEQPVGFPTQTTGFPAQTAVFSGQTGFLGQTTGFPGQQQYGQWRNM